MASLVLGRSSVRPVREAVEWAVGGLPYVGFLVVELDDGSWYVQVVKIAGADHYLMEHRAGEAGRHVWAMACSRDALVRALLGFVERDETWMAGFDWEFLEFDEVTGYACLPLHHPMSTGSGVTVEGYNVSPISVDEHEELKDRWEA